MTRTSIIASKEFLTPTITTTTAKELISSIAIHHLGFNEMITLISSFFSYPVLASYYVCLVDEDVFRYKVLMY